VDPHDPVDRVPPEDAEEPLVSVILATVFVLAANALFVVVGEVLL
jgi:hypothetical protein